MHRFICKKLGKRKIDYNFLVIYQNKELSVFLLKKDFFLSFSLNIWNDLFVIECACLYCK